MMGGFYYRADPQNGRDLCPTKAALSYGRPLIAATDGVLIDIARARASLQTLFAEATVTELDPPCDLSMSSLEEAAKIAGRDGLLICAEWQCLLEAASPLKVGYPELQVRIEPPDVLGSPNAWCLLSADGKKAVVGMR